MNARQLKKRDKKAAAILIACYGYKPDAFAPEDSGGKRLECWYRVSFDCDEWDSKHAYDLWADIRACEHPNFERWYGFDPNTGEPIPEGERPRPMGHRQGRAFYKVAPPAGFRWRGKKVVRCASAGFAKPALRCSAQLPGGVA